MKFCVVGINHHIAPIALREKVHFKETDIIACSEQITGEGIEECIIVSTCNRSEIYFMSRDVIADCGRIKQFYQSYFQTPIEDAFFIEKVSDDAIRHLFYVSVGLDSAVVGEDQILGQVVDAQETAINIGSTGKGINKIFREAITFSKEVKTQTNVSHTPVSIAYIGVKQIARFVDLKTARVLVSGLGNMGRLAAVHLMDSGAEVFVTNRTIENSYKIQRERPGVQVLPFEKLKENIERVDVVVSATSSPHVIIKEEHVAGIQKPLYILDLSLPRDVSPDVGEKENITLFDIDSLQKISEESQKQKKEILDGYRDAIETKIQEIQSWDLNRKVDPLMKSLNERCDEIANQTLNYIFRKTELNHSEQKKVDKIVRAALKKVMREPILSLKEMEDFATKESVIQTLEEMLTK